MVSGVELVDDADADADTGESSLYSVDDEFSGVTSDEMNTADSSAVSVTFHCYHSLPSAHWPHHLQVSCCTSVVVTYCPLRHC